jgi:SAM-dependent methyltransferase
MPTGRTREEAMPGDYPDHFVRRLELLWGQGFMSPGGADEVRAIADGISLAGLKGLDIGCGIGGPDIVLVRDLGAASVHGVDIDQALLDKAMANAQAAGLADRLSYGRIDPGPLPFAEASYDVVFSKDAFLHVADKPALFAEIGRVLRPGGWLIASDWMASEDRDTIPAWQAYQARAPYPLRPATEASSARDLRAAGFIEVATRDRNAWYKEIATRDLALIEGALRDDLIAASSLSIYTEWLAMRRSQTAAVVAGALRPTHLRGRRP